MKKLTLASAGAGWRTAILAAASTIALTVQANAQSAEEDRKRNEAGRRVAASYGIDLDTITASWPRRCPRLR